MFFGMVTTSYEGIGCVSLSIAYFKNQIKSICQREHLKSAVSTASCIILVTKNIFNSNLGGRKEGNTFI